MSATPPDDFSGFTREPAPAAVPSGGEFSTAWIAYGCFFVGVLLWWPSIIGLIISYVRRNEPDAGFIGSHYRWLIGTFWWSTLAWLVSIGFVLGGVLPIVIDVLRSAQASGQRIGEVGVQTLVSIDWGSIFAAAGMAFVGGVGLLGTYLWLLYRLIRGALRLADARPVP